MFFGYFDGAATPNPGEAGAGAYIEQDGKILWQEARYLGRKTNNEAEYEALIILLEAIKRLNIKEIVIRGDSQLVIKQMKGEWGVNEPHLQVLANKAKKLLLDGMNVTFEWVKRESNTKADMLSNKAVDGINLRKEIVKWKD